MHNAGLQGVCVEGLRIRSLTAPHAQREDEEQLAPGPSTLSLELTQSTAVRSRQTKEQMATGSRPRPARGLGLAPVLAGA